MPKISILMYDPILHSDTGVNSKVPLAYLPPLKEEDCVRARFITIPARTLQPEQPLTVVRRRRSLALP